MLYDFGAVSGAVDARRSLEQASSARSAQKSSDLALRAISAWLELFRTRQISEVSQMNVLSRKQILSFIEEREQLGASARSDVLRARARLADAQVSSVAAGTRLKSAEAVYREIFSETAPESLPLPEAPALDLSLYTDMPALFSKNPQVNEARSQTQAAGFEAKSAAAAILPSLHLDLTARRRDVSGEGVPGTDWTAGLTFKQNLYSGGSDVARKQQAQQKVLESQLSEDNLKRQLERAVALLLADVNNSNAAVAARKESAQVAAVALEAVREQFAFRRGSLLDLLRAQEELYVAGRDLIDGVVDHALVRYRLLSLTNELSSLLELPQQSTLSENAGE
jgi:adhesin transport system outer membrane protein